MFRKPRRRSAKLQAGRLSSCFSRQRLRAPYRTPAPAPCNPPKAFSRSVKQLPSGSFNFAIRVDRQSAPHRYHREAKSLALNWLASLGFHPLSPIAWRGPPGEFAHASEPPTQNATLIVVQSENCSVKQPATRRKFNSDEWLPLHASRVKWSCGAQT